MKRSNVTTVVEIGSAASIVAGVGMVTAAGAFVVAGLLGLAFVRALAQ